MITDSKESWRLNEKLFRQRIKDLAGTVNTKNYIDNPMLFLDRQRFTGYLSRIKIFEQILNVKGSIVECGVYKGGSLMLYYHLASIMEPYGFNRKIYGFDTFEGFRSISKEDGGTPSEEMFSDAGVDVLKKAIEINDLNRAIPHVPKCELIKGDTTKTIPEFKMNNPDLLIALLYLDFDIYEPTKVALENFLSLVPKGGIVAFDELNCKSWPGETKALKEVLEVNKINLKQFSFDPYVSYFVVGS